jgi:hypothetical protein
MAARRLLIVMVVLLVLSSVAAALVPPPPESTTTTDETTTGEGAHQTPKRRTGSLVTARVNAEAHRPERIALAVGDQLSLTVISKSFRQIAVRGLGLLEPAESGSPARFNVLLEGPGSFLVRPLNENRVIARIEVRQPPGRERSRHTG